MPCEPEKGCNRFTPCGVRTPVDAEVPEQLYERTRQLNDGRVGTSSAFVRAGSDRAHAMTAKARGTWASSSFLFNPVPNASQIVGEWLRLRSTSSADLSEAGLRISGPLGDGFWVRAIWVLAHARWAAVMGLPVSVVYRSRYDTYYSPDRAGDGWSQYFVKIDNVPRGAKLIALDCFAAARAWEDMGNYALRSYSNLTAQREQRARLVTELPLKPHRRFQRLADEFWAAHFSPGEQVLGVHLRGTDKQRFRLRVAAFMPLVHAFLCRWPNASIFVATDDSTQLETFRRAVARQATRAPKVVVRDGLRGNGTWNAGVHANHLQLQSQAARLGTDVLVDTLLLAKVSFLLKGISAVAEFALYFAEHLRKPGGSYDLNFMGDRGQPKPPWADACRTRLFSPAARRAIEEEKEEELRLLLRRKGQTEGAVAAPETRVLKRGVASNSLFSSP